MVRNSGMAKSSGTRKSFVSYTSPQSAISEQYRNIRTNLQFLSDEHQARTFIVTSPQNGDGKSTTAVNLAISMAMRGDKVLLVDANFQDPTLHVRFNLTNTTGLALVLSGFSTVAEAVYPTEIGKLDVLPSGPVTVHSEELIGSQSMALFLKEAKEQYNFVLFDSTPVLGVTNTTLLARLCDGVVLVLSSGKTRKETAVEAKEALERAKAKVLGIILNNKSM